MNAAKTNLQRFSHEKRSTAGAAGHETVTLEFWANGCNGFSRLASNAGGRDARAAVASAGTRGVGGDRVVFGRTTSAKHCKVAI